jgi:hypothetical protein
MRVQSSEAISGFLQVFRLGRSSLGANARTQADNCILDYCNWLGDIAKRIAASAAISIDIVKGYAAAFESAGSDEFIFIRATASPDQLELLAGAVL